MYTITKVQPEPDDIPNYYVGENGQRTWQCKAQAQADFLEYVLNHADDQLLIEAHRYGKGSRDKVG